MPLRFETSNFPDCDPLLVVCTTNNASNFEQLRGQGSREGNSDNTPTNADNELKANVRTLARAYPPPPNLQYFNVSVVIKRWRHSHSFYECCR